MISIFGSCCVHRAGVSWRPPPSSCAKAKRATRSASSSTDWSSWRTAIAPSRLPRAAILSAPPNGSTRVPPGACVLPPRSTTWSISKSTRWRLNTPPRNWRRSSTAWRWNQCSSACGRPPASPVRRVPWRFIRPRSPSSWSRQHWQVRHRHQRRHRRRLRHRKIRSAGACLPGSMPTRLRPSPHQRQRR